MNDISFTIFYEQHYLDLIVNFLWTTLSRSNCDVYDPFMNDTNYPDLIVTFLWTTLSRYNCDLFMNDTM